MRIHKEDERRNSKNRRTNTKKQRRKKTTQKSSGPSAGSDGGRLEAGLSGDRLHYHAMPPRRKGGCASPPLTARYVPSELPPPHMCAAQARSIRHRMTHPSAVPAEEVENGNGCDCRNSILLRGCAEKSGPVPEGWAPPASLFDLLGSLGVKESRLGNVRFALRVCCVYAVGKCVRIGSHLPRHNRTARAGCCPATARLLSCSV